MILKLIPVITKIFKSSKLPQKIVSALGLKTDDTPAVEAVLKKAQEIAAQDREVELEMIRAQKEIEGSYAELQTKAEKIIRSMMYHVITLFACFLIGWSVMAQVYLDSRILISLLIIILGRVGQRTYYHLRKE